ncbi:MAG: aspartyl protease family protein [Vulcanisaeta sp.]
MRRAWINAKFINPNTNKEIEIKALVDTGATFTVIPGHIYEELGLRTVGKRRVKTASGYVDMDESFALVEVGNKRGVSPVLVSSGLNEVLIGVITLEALGLTVDPTTGELRETEILML